MKNGFFFLVVVRLRVLALARVCVWQCTWTGCGSLRLRLMGSEMRMNEWMKNAATATTSLWVTNAHALIDFFYFRVCASSNIEFACRSILLNHSKISVFLPSSLLRCSDCSRIRGASASNLWEIPLAISFQPDTHLYFAYLYDTIRYEFLLVSFVRFSGWGLMQSACEIRLHVINGCTTGTSRRIRNDELQKRAREWMVCNIAIDDVHFFSHWPSSFPRLSFIARQQAISNFPRNQKPRKTRKETPIGPRVS